MPIARAGIEYIAPGTGGSGTPGGASGTIQYNNAGSFGGLGVGTGLANTGGSLVNTMALAANDTVAAGGSQAAATQLTLSRNYVLTGAGGVKLPQASTFGDIVVLVRNATGAAITLYPFLGDTIEGNGVNTGIALANGATANASVDGNGIVRIN